MYLSVLIYIVAVLSTAYMFYFWGENLYLKQQINNLLKDDRTKWDVLVETRKNMISVDIHKDLNVDQLEMWTEFIKSYLEQTQIIPFCSVTPYPENCKYLKQIEYK